MSVQPAILAKILQHLGPDVSILASGVSKLLLASPDPASLSMISPESILYQYPGMSDSNWTDAEVSGALLLVRDKTQNNAVFFKIYSLIQETTVLFEYELYDNIDYQASSSSFHCFEIEECVAGFAFCEETVAKRFHHAVLTYRPITKPKVAKNFSKSSSENKIQSSPTGAPARSPAPQNGRIPSQVVGNPQANTKRQFLGQGRAGSFINMSSMIGRGFKSGSKKSSKGRRRKKKGINMDEIGDAINLRHEGHIGVTTDGDFDLQNIPKAWKKLFKEAGVKKKDLRDRGAAAEIFQTLQTAEMDYAYNSQNLSKNPADEYTLQQRLDFERYQEEVRRYKEKEAGIENSAYADTLRDFKARKQAASNRQPSNNLQTDGIGNHQSGFSFLSNHSKKQSSERTMSVQPIFAPPPVTPRIPSRAQSPPVPARTQSAKTGSRKTGLKKKQYEQIQRLETLRKKEIEEAKREEKSKAEREQRRLENIEKENEANKRKLAAGRGKLEEVNKLRAAEELRTKELQKRTEAGKQRAIAEERERVQLEEKKRLAVEEKLREEQRLRDEQFSRFQIEEQKRIEEKKRIEAELQRKEEQEKQLREEMKRKEEEQRKLAEQLRLKQEEQAKTEEERARSEETRKQKETEKRIAEEVKRKKEEQKLAELERVRKEEEENKFKEQVRRNKEEQMRMEEKIRLEEQKKFEQEMRLKQAEQQKLTDQKKAELELRRREEDEKRQKVEKEEAEKRELERQKVEEAQKEQIRAMEERMKEALEQMAKAEAAAEKLQEDKDALLKLKEEEENDRKQEIEKHKEEFEKLKAHAEELSKAKEKEKAEKLLLAQAKEEAESAKQALIQEKELTEKQREEAFQKIEQTERAVEEARKKVQQTEEKLKQAEEIAKAIPPPPPALPTLPQLPPLVKRNAPAMPPLPPAPTLPPPPGLSFEKEKCDTQKNGKPVKGPLNLSVLSGIKKGVSLTPVKKATTPAVAPRKGFLSELKQRALKPKEIQRRSVLRALSVRLNRVNLGNQDQANFLMQSLQNTILERRERLKGRTGNEDDDDSDSDWSV